MAPDPYSRNCPSRPLLKSLGDLWTVLVIGALHHADRPQRFKEISVQVDGISTKMLTQTLRGLERDGLLERHQYPEIPPRVTYELTDSGKGLAEALAQVEAWATDHLGAVTEARARYDAAH
ncbi:transcriptional regulator [Actinomyces oris]|uniref:Transcriptional regulator n=2 Tax=Actinomyces TaxID=1654 RepID=A0A1Q8VNI2_9ACTO|nr:transcriptional regulator [Actinomyces oris]